LLRYDPLFFGRTGLHRFDAPAGEYGVLYAGQDAHCAFIETHGDLVGVRIVSMSALAQRGFALVEATQPLRLADLTGPGLARLGADERLACGEHTIARRWALAVWSHLSLPDGLLYRARHDPSRWSAAIYDRAAPHLKATRLGSLLDGRHAALLADVLDTYGFSLIGL
jgi:hypothetical protein